MSAFEEKADIRWTSALFPGYLAQRVGHPAPLLVLIPQFMGTQRLLLSLPLAVPHEAVALDEMQMQLSRLTPAILISLGNTVARRRNLSRRFWFR